MAVIERVAAYQGWPLRGVHCRPLATFKHNGSYCFLSIPRPMIVERLRVEFDESSVC